MLTQLLSIARNTFIESLRQPVLLILILLSGLFQIFNTWSSGFAMGQSEAAEVEGDNKLLLDIGLATVFVFGTLLASFIATAALSREIENKTVLTIVSKPVGRPVLVLGKYLGIAGSILLAVAVMLLFLLFAIRHGVMSTASDILDGPVLAFSFAAVFLALAAAAWTNFFYNWSFPQVASALLLPLVTIAYLLTLALSKKWELQSLFTDFKPQITVACACLTLAILVLTAIATAASTRLGQVMTIVVCAGVFLTALLSNYFIGRYAFSNTVYAEIAQAQPEADRFRAFATPGDTYLITLKGPPREPITPGTPFYYGPTPSGFPLSTASFSPTTPSTFNPDLLLREATPPAVVVTAVNDLKLTVRHAGGSPLTVRQPPQSDDYVFIAPTRINAFALTLWGVIPNLQFFWLLDAVTQNRPVPVLYLALATAYALVQVVAALCVAVLLFQKRDVG